MTSCQRTPTGPLLPTSSGEIISSRFTDTSASRLLSEFSLDIGRPSALATLLLLVGASNTGDTALVRLTETELSLLRETLDLLNRTEAASAA